MDTVHDDMENEILAAIRAGRELSPDQFSELAALTADRISRVIETGTGNLTKRVDGGGKPLPFIEVGAAGAALVCGSSATLYVMEELQTGSALGLDDPVRQTVHHSLQVATPFMLLTALLLAVFFVASILDGAVKIRGGVFVVAGCALALAADGCIALSRVASYLAPLTAAGLASMNVVLVLSAASLLGAIVSCAAATARRLFTDVPICVGQPGDRAASVF